MIKEIFIIGLIIILGIGFASLFSKKRIPDVLSLMLLGVVLGPVTGLIVPESFGRAAEIFSTLALILVLFKTGLHLRFSALREAWGRGSALTVTFFALFGLATFLCAHYAFNLSFMFSAIIAVIAADNSVVVVLPILNKLPLSKKTKTILMMENTVGGALSVVLTLAFIKFAVAQEIASAQMPLKLLYSFATAALIGLLCGFAWTLLSSRIRSLENSISLTFASLLLVYAACVAINAEGAIGVLSFGIAIGNIRVVKTLWLKNFKMELKSFNETEKVFFSELEFILKTLFFVYMGISLKFGNGTFLVCGAILALIKVAVRAPVVRLVFCSQATKRECALATALCPNGLISAVLASGAAAQLEGGAAIESIIFSLIFFSVILMSILSYIIEKGWMDGINNWFFPNHISEETSTTEK